MPDFSGHAMLRTIQGKYNLTVSFRLSWCAVFQDHFLYAVALFGFHPVIIFITNQIAILFQFWVHTEYIRKTHPIIEYSVCDAFQSQGTSWLAGTIY